MAVNLRKIYGEKESVSKKNIVKKSKADLEIKFANQSNGVISRQYKRLLF
jgi:hypothetical protein|tara:strand:- start:839 stop:988 length:150 start_codon:yes stop_codon:yes gene_type:complete